MRAHHHEILPMEEGTAMQVLLQICAVIVTMALVAIAVVAVRAMARFEKTSEELGRTAEAIRESIGQVQSITHEAKELIGSLGGAVQQIRGTASRFQDLGDRAARLSTSVLEEVETPVRTVVAVARGVRSGTSVFFERIGNRLGHRFAHRNGGTEHE
jgi:uncharacterized protein YoxC